MQALFDGPAGCNARVVALPGVLLFAALSCAVAAAQDSGRDALTECLAQLEDVPATELYGDAAEAEEEGYDFTRQLDLGKLEKVCPDLKQALESSPYAAWLPEEWWSSRLSIPALEELREQISREAEAPPPGSIDTKGVAAALDSLGEDATSDRVSWWRRFIEWLTGRTQVQSDEPPAWLIRFLQKLGDFEVPLRITAYCLVALLVILAVVVAVNELRAAGVFGPRARAARLQRSLEKARREHALSLRDLEGLEPTERPSLLLTLIVAALAQRSRLRVDASATHRELLARLVPDSAEQRAQLARLTRCAERVRYSGSPPSGRDIEDAVAGGRRLLDSVLREPAAHPA